MSIITPNNRGRIMIMKICREKFGDQIEDIHRLRWKKYAAVICIFKNGEHLNIFYNDPEAYTGGRVVSYSSSCDPLYYTTETDLKLVLDIAVKRQADGYRDPCDHIYEEILEYGKEMSYSTEPDFESVLDPIIQRRAEEILEYGQEM